MALSDEELRRRRSAAQMLGQVGGANSRAVVGRLLAVQAQQIRSARLALRARARDLVVADIDRDLAAGSLLVTWLMRGTLHLVLAGDYPWLLSLTAPTRMTANRRRLGQEGVSPAQASRAIDVIDSALAEHGPLTRAALTAHLDEGGIPTAGQAVPHLLMSAALAGRIVLGPVTADGHAFARVPDWLGRNESDPLGGQSRERAFGELARRYLSGHGPATPIDLHAWSGLPQGAIRAGLRDIAGELVELGDGYVDLVERAAPDEGEPAPPRLLPSFDPYLLGWRDRGFAVPARHAKLVHPGGGVLRAVATSDGRVVGTWVTRHRRGGLTAEVEPFEALAPEVWSALDAESTDIARFLAPQ